MSQGPVVVLTGNPLHPIDVAAAEAGLDGAGQVVEFDLPRQIDWPADLEAVAAALADAEGMLLRIGTLDRQLIQELPRLRVVALHGVGVDQVDVEAAVEHGIVVTNVPGGNTQAVVELTIGLMIAMLRRIVSADSIMRESRDWDGARYLGHELGSRTVGLIGFGNIARGVAKTCQALGSEVIATRRDGIGSIVDGVPIVSLDDLLANADIVSIHVPLTKATHSLLNDRALARMRPGSFVVNTARGPIIDQQALENALFTGHIAGAALDILQNEPPDWNTPLLEMPNVVLTPHMGGSTHEALATIAFRAAQDIARVLRGQTAVHQVSP